MIAYFPHRDTIDDHSHSSRRTQSISFIPELAKGYFRLFEVNLIQLTKKKEEGNTASEECRVALVLSCPPPGSAFSV